ncbi:MAG: Rrf2 family transcriptional regulator [Oscillospiraceae bacterium]|nr:Rrf2 family transcriptional regulator [Oscillospiraceae bacterium]
MNSDFVVALHAVTYLCHKGTTLNSEALAQNICTNPARVRRVMAKLSRAGLVETREGRADGGYRCESRDMTLDRLADALGIRFPDVGWKSGDPGDPCMVCSGMPAYMEILDQGLNDRLRDYLRGITVADVERWLAENKERKDGK